MSKVVLIAGSETLLGRKLVEKELDLGNRVVAPVNSRKESSGSESSRANLLVLPWNRSSLFSTKTVIQEAYRQWKTIDQSLIIDSGQGENSPFTNLSLSEIDETVDRDIKGTLYLSRELLSYYAREDKQSLLTFIRQENSTQGSSLSSGCSGFFRDFSDRLIQEKLDSVFMCGFINMTKNVDICANYIIEICKSKPEKAWGEWLKVSDKKSLFSLLPIEKRS